MSTSEAHRKAERAERLLAEIGCSRTTDGRSPAPLLFWVPGRIEVLGKHTDYGGGRSLLCAVERGFCLAAIPRETESTRSGAASSGLVRIRDVDSDNAAEFELSPDVPARPGHWSNYPITVARRIASNFSGPMRGADMVFSSDLPPAAGVSSSSALVVATFLALSEVNRLGESAEYRANIHTPEDLAGYLGAVENGLDFKELRGHAGVGTFGGSEDQTAILCSRANSLVQYSFCPVVFERAVPLPAGYGFVIASSGVLAEKTGAALDLYNRVSRRLSVGLERWRQATGRSDGSMQAAIQSAPGAADRIRDVLRSSTDAEYPSRSLLQRFDQFDREANEIIPAAGDALGRDDLSAFGDLVAESQHGAERALENQIPETIALVQSARELGAVAASAFGAGFGGSVWALVKSSSTDEFRAEWSREYAAAFPDSAPRAEFFATLAGPPAMRLQ